MKRFLLLILIAASISMNGQVKPFLIEGRIVDIDQNPIPDAYIINYRNQDKSVSLPNGIFEVLVHPEDSLIISHISEASSVSIVRFSPSDVVGKVVEKIRLRKKSNQYFTKKNPKKIRDNNHP